MSIALVFASLFNNDAAADPTLPAVDSTGSTLLLFPLASFGADTVDPVDSNGNTWTPGPGPFGHPKTRIFHADSPPIVGSGHTATCSAAVTYGATIGMAGFSGTAASPLDQESGFYDGGSPATLQAGSVTPTEDGELCVAVLSGLGVAFSATIDEGYTIIDQVPWRTSPAAHYAMLIAYKIQGPATATNPTWTITASGGFQASAALSTFKAAAGGGGPGPSITQLIGALGDEMDKGMIGTASAQQRTLLFRALDADGVPVTTLVGKAKFTINAGVPDDSVNNITALGSGYYTVVVAPAELATVDDIVALYPWSTAVYFTGYTAAIVTVNDLSLPPEDSAAIADAVLDAATADHQIAGSIGKAITDAQSAGDPLTAAVPGTYGAGTAGKIIGDLAGTKTDTAAIKLKTDNLPPDPADQSLIINATNAIQAAIAALNDLSAVGVRTAIGLAAPNLDAQLDALPTATENAAAVASAAAATPLPANMVKQVGVPMIGDGTDANPWRATGT
jgi:hypothetical protein